MGAQRARHHFRDRRRHLGRAPYHVHPVPGHLHGRAQQGPARLHGRLARLRGVPQQAERRPRPHAAHLVRAVHGVDQAAGHVLAGPRQQLVLAPGHAPRVRQLFAAQTAEQAGHVAHEFHQARDGVGQTGRPRARLLPHRVQQLPARLSGRLRRLLLLLLLLVAVRPVLVAARRFGLVLLLRRLTRLLVRRSGRRSRCRRLPVRRLRLDAYVVYLPGKKRRSNGSNGSGSSK